MKFNTKSIITFFIAAGIVASIWLLIRPATDPAAIAYEYLLPYPNLISPLQQQNSNDSTSYAEAFRMYELGYHGKAEDLFMSLDRNDEAVQFYRSLNALLAHNPELARKGFDGILEHQEHQFYRPAQWYSALDNLQNDKKGQAVLLLNDLANGDSEFAEMASGLLDKLN